MLFKTLPPMLLIAIISSGAYANERIASFDLGSLDTLAELDAQDQVVGLPKQSLPTYLSEYKDSTYADLGGLRSPDFDAISQSDPTLILYTGRQGEWEAELADIAILRNVGLQGEDYLAAFDANVRQLGREVGAEERAEQALEALHTHIETQRDAIDRATRVLTVTHNDGNLGLNTHPVIHDVLGIEMLEMPDSVESITRGNRVFTPLTLDAIGEIHPDVLLVVDRSAAIGETPADTDTLQLALTDAGALNTRMVILTPELWYLSGGGLQSLALQVEEVATALSSSP